MKAKAKSWFRIRAGAQGSVPEIILYGDIGGFGVTAESFMHEFQALGSPSKVRIRINSDGGDVFAGNAIYNMLQRSLAHKEVVIDGLAASIASVIAMAGDEIVMPKNSMLMIHNPWGVAVGQSQEIISFGEALSDMRDGIVAAYTDKSGLNAKRVVAMMDKETWLSAARAVELGFATRVAQPVEMNAAVFTNRIGKFTNVPASFRASLKESAMTNRNAKDEIFGDDDDNATAAESMRAEVVKVAKDIRAMCKLAGKPEAADKFIEDGLTVEECLAELQKKPAKNAPGPKAKDGDGEIDPHNAGGGDGEVVTLDNRKIWDRFNAFKAKRSGRRAA